MLRKKTLLILGAGASADVGLPVGSELRGKITADLSEREGRDGVGIFVRDPTLQKAIELHGQLPERANKYTISQYLEAAQRIVSNVDKADSIDSFIESQDKDPLIADVGKLAIAHCILLAEKGSDLYKGPISEYEKVNGKTPEKYWITQFMRIVVSGVPASNVDDIFRNLAVINFNYDRCFEHFVYNWIVSYYDLDAQLARSLTSAIPILHPYGSLGPLWATSGNMASIPFGAHNRNAQQILLASQRIKTYSEQYDQEIVRDFLAEHVKESEKVIFLGFGFHQQNMDLISVDETGPPKKIFATCDMDEVNWKFVKRRIKDSLCRDYAEVSIILDRLYCSQFFEKYRIAISS